MFVAALPDFFISLECRSGVTGLALWRAFGLMAAGNPDVLTIELAGYDWQWQRQVAICHRGHGIQ
jgi:hypothetical protein